MDANFYNLNGNGSGSGIDLSQPAQDLNNDGYYDLTPTFSRYGEGSGYFRVEFDSPVDLTSFVSGGSYSGVYHAFRDAIAVNANYSEAGGTYYFPHQYDGGGSPPLYLEYAYAENAGGGSFDRWSSSVSDYTDISALNYRVYFSEGIQDDFEATINVNFSDLNVYGVRDNHIGNYYANGSSGAGYYTQENEVVTVDPSSYLGDDASYYQYGPNGAGVYSGGSIGYQEVGRDLYIGMSDLRANYTSVDNGVHGSGYYENVAPQVLGDYAEAFDSNGAPQFFNNGENGSGWYLSSGRSGSVG